MSQSGGRRQAASLENEHPLALSKTFLVPARFRTIDVFGTMPAVVAAGCQNAKIVHLLSQGMVDITALGGPHMHVPGVQYSA